MITFSIIKKSQLEGAMRIDAEYYQPEYLDIVKNLSKHKISKFEDILSDIRYGLYVEPDYQERGANFLRALNLIDYGIDGEILKIRKEEIPNNKYLLKQGDTLIVRSGANTGNVGVVEKYLENSTFGSYTICLRTAKINPYFFYIFLNSKFGKLQTLRMQTGMAQPNLNIPNIKEIKIPVDIESNKQKSIEDIVLKAFEVKENSKKYYHQAENLLLEELGLKDLAFEENLATVVNLSEVQEARRMDAEYFQEEYKKILDVVNNRFEIKNLSEIFDFRRGIFVSTDYYSEVKNKTPYIRIKELPGKGSINKEEIIYINDKYKGNENDKIQENDLIMAIIGDTIGKTGLVDKELNGGFCSNNTGRLRIKKDLADKFIPEFNELLFQSVFIQKQIEQKKAQTGQPKINNDEIRSIKIPILPKPTQQKIAGLIQKSHTARKKAKFLLDEAKRKAENLIENQ